MRTENPSPAPRAPRRSAAPLDPDLRARLESVLANTQPERIAADALVSVATVRRARDGGSVQPFVRASIARVIADRPVAA